MYPKSSIVIPCGAENWPRPWPDSPNEYKKFPEELKTNTLSELSVTKTSPVKSLISTFVGLEKFPPSSGGTLNSNRMFPDESNFITLWFKKSVT